MVASALLAAVDSGRQFNNGRQMAAWLGLVPRQHDSGGKVTLHGITKNGDRTVRTLLIHGARAALRWSRGKVTPQGRWLTQLEARCGTNKAVVALANKLARFSWNILANDVSYDPSKALDLH